MFLSVVAFSLRFAVFFDALSVIWHARVCWEVADLWGLRGWDVVGVGVGVGWGGGRGVGRVGGGLITFLFIYDLTTTFLSPF